LVSKVSEETEPLKIEFFKLPTSIEDSDSKPEMVPSTFFETNSNDIWALLIILFWPLVVLKDRLAAKNRQSENILITNFNLK
jgi:hypothetical protein